MPKSLNVYFTNPKYLYFSSIVILFLVFSETYKLENLLVNLDAKIPTPF